MAGGLMRGVDEWEERDDCSFMCRVTLVRACERESVSLMILLYLCAF